MPCVLLVRVQRHGTVPPGSRQTVVAEVNGINKRTLRHDVRRQLALYRGEHTAVMHVRCSPLVAEHQEHHRPHRHSHVLPLPVIGGAAADLVLYIYGDVVGAMGRPHDPEAILSGKASKATAFFRALCQTLDPLSRDRFRDWILERFWSGEEAGGYKVLLSVVTSSNASAMVGEIDHRREGRRTEEDCRTPQPPKKRGGPRSTVMRSMSSANVSSRHSEKSNTSLVVSTIVATNLSSF